MKQIQDIPVSTLPIAKLIKEIIDDLSEEKKKELFEAMTEDEFIEQRVELYLKEYEFLTLSGQYDEAGVIELAKEQVLWDLK